MVELQMELPQAGVEGARTLRRGYTPSVAEYGTLRVKTGLAEMLKGGVIMDVVDAPQARIAEDAGACAVMALERVPADIRRDGGVARMADPLKIREIQESVTIPVMAKCRIGHFAEAQILEALEVDYIDESEVLTPASLSHHVDKWQFTVPFVCGATNLGEALRRISEGAAMIRTKGEAGTGDIVNAETHMRAVFGGIRQLQAMREDELHSAAKEHRAPYELVQWVAEHGRLPVVTFTAGGIATPADAALCMQLGADGVFVGSGIFKSGRDPHEDREGWMEDVSRRARAIVEATTHFTDAKVLAEVSTGLGQPMVGISATTLPDEERLEVRGW
jgi:pyridoxal 5'-phosphate synthase pdxS subunit